MANNDEKLIQAIVANPSDEPSWLVYADWLEENGDSRCEFIRLSHQIDALKSRTPEKRALILKLRKMMRLFDSKWLERLQFIKRDEYLRDASEAAFNFMQYNSYGSEERAIRLLHCRVLYIGFSREDVESDFRLAVQLQRRIRTFKAELPANASRFMVEQISNLTADLRTAFPNVNIKTIECAIGKSLTSWNDL